jgi:hypothetical protein
MLVQLQNCTAPEAAGKSIQMQNRCYAACLFNLSCPWPVGGGGGGQVTFWLGRATIVLCAEYAGVSASVLPHSITVQPSSFPANLCAGEAVECELYVENMGTVGLQNLTSNHSGCTGLASLVPGASAVCTVSQESTMADFSSAEFDAAVTVAVQVTGSPTADISPSMLEGVASSTVQLPIAPQLSVVGANASSSDFGAGLRAGERCCQ